MEPNEEEIAETICGLGAAEERNAALIAAAPCLLSALEFVRDNHHEGDGELDRVVRSAIAKTLNTR